MSRGLLVCCLVIVLSVWRGAFAAEAQEAIPETLLKPQSSLLTWIVGFGILAGTLMAGFKHPGRTHLD